MGTISRSAVREFLNRKLKDCHSYKHLPEKVIRRRLERSKPYLQLHTKPRWLQRVSLLLGMQYRYFMFLATMGGGKTKITLDLFTYWKNERVVKRGLIFVPNAANIDGWIDEIKIHAPHLTVTGLDQSGKEAREEAIFRGSDLVITTYQGWCSLICDVVKVRPGRSKRKKKSGWKINESRAHRFEKEFQFVGWDEITKLTHYGSLYSQSARRFKPAHVRYGFTGTPFGKNPEALWSQFFCVDRGETLGPTLGLFHQALFIEKPNPWFKYGSLWKFDERMWKVLYRMLKHGSIRFGKDESPDLPPIVELEDKLRFTDEIWRYHESLIDDLETQKTFKASKSVWNRMRNLCSGYLPVKDKQKNVHVIKFQENPKMDALIERLQQIPDDEKVIVFNVYQNTGKMICERLVKEKMPHIRMYSGTNNQKVMRQFKANPKIKILVASSSVAYGHNLQLASYILMYESPSDPKEREQVIARVHRTGQKRRTVLVDIFIRGSVEERILQSIRKGQDLFARIVDGKDKLKKGGYGKPN